MDLGNGLGPLSYSTLVHPGDTWAEMKDSLQRYLPGVKARVSPMVRQTPLSDHLEIETYTWDVLPAQLKTGDITEYITSELEFVRSELV